MRRIALLGLTGLGVAVVIAALPQALDWASAQQDSDSGFKHVVIDAEGPADPWGKASGDIDGDGRPDLLVGGHSSQELVWYRNPSWEKSTIATGERFSTDHAVADIDGDGRNDVVSLTKTHLLWYRNPQWTPTIIDAVALHDVEVADFDGDGDPDLVARDQSAFSGSGSTLFFYRQDGPTKWMRFTVAVPDGEGLAVADIDDDARPDVIVNGKWYRNPGALDGSQWPARTYTDTWDWPHTYIDVGDINEDGRVDILLAPAEPKGERYRIAWFEAPDNPAARWAEHVIDSDVETVHHFVGLGDLDNDGHLDVASAQMHQGADPDAIKVYFNRRGHGAHWDKAVLAASGSHSMRLVDIDADGDLDLFGANWSGSHQPVELWVNQTCPPRGSGWRRHVLDADRPWRAVFVTSADIDGDGLTDVIAGGWWYRNPGKTRDRWVRNAIGDTARQMAAVHDLDDDGDPDVLATRGTGSEPNADFVWARNDGQGGFEVMPVAHARGDFLQGVAVADLAPSRGTTVALSWHKPGHGVQLLTAPENPGAHRWAWQGIASVSQDEALSAGDIDGDGRVDLLLGTRWLHNDGDGWSELTLFDTEAKPDRNRLADINGDGRLDAIVGYEAISSEGVVAWYEQGESATQPWREHIVARVIGPMSLDVADMDADGDLDVVVGEHDLKNPDSARLLILENIDGAGAKWGRQVLYTGDEHHDGAHVVDLDGDGDQDVVSIGWGHRRVLFYENRAANCPGGPTEEAAS